MADFEGLPFRTERGRFVARKRPTASDVQRPTLTCLDGASHSGRQLLTRAEARALRLSAAVTHAKLAQHLRGIDLRSRPRV